jgi:FAD dependent oxidoreductase
LFWPAASLTPDTRNLVNSYTLNPEPQTRTYTMNLSPNFKETPYWLDPPPLVKSFPGAALPARTDVLVVGSGYTGLAAAIRLKQAGLRVALIDRLKLGTAASARNGGMTLTGLSADLSKIEKKTGERKSKAIIRRVPRIRQYR